MVSFGPPFCPSIIHPDILVARIFDSGRDTTQAFLKFLYYVIGIGESCEEGLGWGCWIGCKIPILVCLNQLMDLRLRQKYSETLVNEDEEFGEVASAVRYWRWIRWQWSGARTGARTGASTGMNTGEKSLAGM